MAHLPSVHWQDAARAFEKAGWVHDRTRGSHYIMIKANEPALLSIPLSERRLPKP